MNRGDKIDITFDFRTDTPPGKDPDAHSQTLRRYHQLLWSKCLPDGHCFELLETTPRSYLHHKSELGEFWLSSDAVIPTFSQTPGYRHIIRQVSLRELEWFNTITYTIGGMMLFPGQRVDGKMTINGARGFHPGIRDRFDLTVECILRYYRHLSSPLHDTLARYADFFGLFGDFRGFIDFFFLQDIVEDDFSTVKFFTTFDNFKASPLPHCKEQYISYMNNAIGFVEARNRRIFEYWQAHGTS